MRFSLCVCITLIAAVLALGLFINHLNFGDILVQYVSYCVGVGKYEDMNK